MAKIKEGNQPLTHAEMNANFEEVTAATVAIADIKNTLPAQITQLEAQIASLTTSLNALQAELDANQQTADNITQGVIARINAAKIVAEASVAEITSLKENFTTTTVADLDTLIIAFYDALLLAGQETIADYDAQIDLLDQEFII